MPIGNFERRFWKLGIVFTRVEDLVFGFWGMSIGR